MLCYLLGRDKVVRKNLQEYSSKSHLHILYYPHMSDDYVPSDNFLGKGELWDVSPFAWIGYIENANVVFTDSYHMTLFSIMYHKNFWVFTKDENRKAQSNRIFHILKFLGLESRFIKKDEIINVIGNNHPIQWDEVDKKLFQLRNKTLQIWDSLLAE